MSAVSRKRRGDDASASRPKNDRFQKKRKRAQQTAYHSDSDSIEGGSDEEGDDLKVPESLGLKDNEEDGSDDGFQAVDLLDSDDENLDALADDGASSDEDENDEMNLEGVESGDDDDEDNNDEDSLDSLSDNGDSGKTTKKSPAKAKAAQRVAAARDAPTDSEGDDDDEDDDAYNSGDDSDNGAGARAPKSKRNDPATFATSLSKILGTKLSTTRRADPVLARSADAREASRRVVDAGLEEKARRQMRLEKRAALERGRVKDVLIATAKPQAEGITAGDAAGEVNVGETTTTILATERRLRKVAQRGVVQLFNAVRAAQVKAAQAKKQAKAEGMIGMDKREAKVTEMSRKGFLDLIASGGGGLKKGGLEEA